MPADNPSAATGRTGEDVAAHYVARRGCEVLARNWRANPGEVDIVAQCPANHPSEQPVLTFIEVRTRHGQRGLAEESISSRKATSMASAAYAYMAAHNLDPNSTPWRIDLVAISMSGPNINSINWIKGTIDEEMVNA